jgi:steroid delta-isomerase-like uncharacterized protein
LAHAGGGDLNKTSNASMIGNSAAAIMRQYWAHVSAGETAALASFFAEDAYFEDVALGHSYNGRDHIAGILTKFFGVMPCRFEVENIIEQGDQFAAQWTVSGNHTAEILKFPAPTGKSFRYRGVSFGVVKDGLIRRKSDYWDFSTLLAQISG